MMNNDKPCIIFALPSLNGGGAQRVVLNLINNWQEDNYRPILLLSELKGEYINQVNPDIEIITLNIPMGFFNAPRFSFKLKKALEGYNPKMIISHMDTMNRMLLRAKKIKAVDAPLMLVIHNDISTRFSKRFWLANLFHKAEAKWLYNSADYVVGVSTGVAQVSTEFLSLKKEAKEIYNPVDIEEIKASLNKSNTDPFAKEFINLPKPIILGVGRLVKQKGFDTLICAFSKLPQNVRGSLVILGEGDLKHSLKMEAQRLNIEDQVYFPGFVNNPWWYMARSDLFVLSSNSEGFGLVIIEAMISGVPVISTDCSYGPSELIKDGENGKLVPVDDTEAMCKGMVEVLVSKTISKKFIEHGFRNVDKYRPELIVDEYLILAGLK